WLLSGRASGPPALRLLDDFRRQLQHDRPRDDLELELLAGASGPRQSCPGSRNGDGYHAVPDAIIRTKDSIAAGASFLRAPAAVRDWRQCVAVCCSEPRCSLAVVEQLPPRKPAAAALGCYLFNCTARGRSVCKFAPHRGYSTYVLSRAPGVPPLGSSSGKKRKEKTFIFESQSDPGRREHPAPEAGAVLPLALGSAITALLLFLVACRLRMVKQKLRKARPMTSEESDYLINGMYL
uniref:Low density lipoprotein receptor-related protein 11 n=1 Tax=Jaculus jaculus TaxID=51337 RepID=A0A8C5LL82_JACJA